MDNLNQEARQILEQFACPICYETKPLILCCAEGHPLCNDCKSRMDDCGICRGPFLPICPPCRPVNGLLDSFGIAPPPPPPPPRPPPPRPPHSTRGLFTDLEEELDTEIEARIEAGVLYNQTREVKDLGGKLRRLYKKLEYENNRYTFSLNHSLSVSARKFQRRLNSTQATIADTEILFIQRHGRAFRGHRISIG